MKARQPPAAQAPRGPFSRPLRMREIPDSGLDTTVEASPDECVAIAASVGLPSLASLVARYRIERRAGGRLDVSGNLDAVITQICVITLEPFESKINQPIELAFAPETPDEHFDLREIRTRASERGSDRKKSDRAIVDSVAGNDDQPDPPDPIIDDKIDLGAAAVEFLALSLDPYPKKPGVHFNDMLVGEDDEAEPSPFAALGRLKDRS